MSKVIAVTSGKGGTGKSSICSGLGYSLAKMGNRTLIIELDFGLRCIDIIFGMSNDIKQDLGTVLQGKCEPIDAVTQVKAASNLKAFFVLLKPFTVVTAEQIADICQQVKNTLIILL